MIFTKKYFPQIKMKARERIIIKATTKSAINSKAQEINLKHTDMYLDYNFKILYINYKFYNFLSYRFWERENT